MKKYMLNIALLMLCLSLPLVVFAADWPQFRGPQANGIAPDQGINKNWAQRPPEELWRVALGDDAYAGPAVAADRPRTTSKSSRTSSKPIASPARALKLMPFDWCCSPWPINWSTCSAGVWPTPGCDGLRCRRYARSSSKLVLSSHKALAASGCTWLRDGPTRTCSAVPS